MLHANIYLIPPHKFMTKSMEDENFSWIRKYYYCEGSFSVFPSLASSGNMRCIILRTIIFLCRYATNTKSSPGSCIINAPSGNICWITVRTMIEASPLTSRISATNAKFHPDLELLMQHRGTYVRLQSTRCIRIKSDLILFNSISYFSQGEYFRTFWTF